MPEPLALNLHVFLDDVTEHNGPLVFIRGSHRGGPVSTALDTETTSYALWTVDNATVSQLAKAGGLASATGPAGTALIFGDCLVHGSPGEHDAQRDGHDEPPHVSLVASSAGATGLGRRHSASRSTAT